MRPEANPPARADAPGSQLGATRVFLRPIANPFALGFMGLAGATLVASGVELGWIPHAEQHQAALIILVFAPLLQLVSSVFGFLARDPVAATGTGILSGSWLVVGVSLLSSPPGSRSHALATLLFVAGGGLILSALVAAQSKLVPAVVLFTAGLRFVFTAAYHIGGGATWKEVAGICGIVLCGLALYAVASLELEDVRHRPLLPTLRHGAGKRALDGRLADQVDGVAGEAGVRSQL